MNSLTFEARVNAEHLVLVPEEVPVGTLVRIRIEPLTGDPLLDNYQPRTEIGRLALAARKAHIEAGGQLLSWDEINEEVRQRRGGVSELGLKLMAIRQRAIAGGMKLDSVDDILNEVREGRAEVRKIHHRGHRGHREEKERGMSDE